MNYIFFMLAVICYVIYLFLKYEDCRANSEMHPNFIQVVRYKMSDENAYRNARAFRTFSIFTLIMGLFAIPFSPSLAELLEEDEFISIVMKMLVLLLIGGNFFARYILYKEGFRDKASYSMPLQEIIDIYRSTGWFSRGKDFVSMVVNLSTLIGLLLCGFIVVSFY